MNPLQNLHTHSTYCDGSDTPEQIVEEALARGFGAIGFSGHSYMSYSPYSDYGKKPDKTPDYITNVKYLKEKYKDKIEIYLGLEADSFHSTDLSQFEYTIGSVHYFKFGDNYVGFDRNSDSVQAVINDYFAGNGLSYAKAYYELLARLPEFGRFDIIGHFDLITKHSEKVDFFDEDSPVYKRAAIEAAEALRGKIPFFEVNTGAISRGYRTTPYPSLFILKELNRLGFGAIISSDCHNKKDLTCGFDQAKEMLAYCGFKEKYIKVKNGFKAVEL